jgi:hypothetical protein
MTDLWIHTENRRLLGFLTSGQFQEALDHWYIQTVLFFARCYMHS